jgi:hypothetical protein
MKVSYQATPHMIQWDKIELLCRERERERERRGEERRGEEMRGEGYVW